MLEKLGCSWVVVGHSERREYHSETNEQVAAKAAKAIEHGIAPIVCVGEPLEVREAGEHVYAADVTLPSGVTLVSDPELLVINVSEPVEQDLGEEPEAEDAEGETAQESAGESSDDE